MSHSYKVSPRKLSRRLRAVRERCGLTQEQASNLADLSAKYYQNLESGRRTNPSFEALNRIAHAFRVPIYELFYDPAELRRALCGERRNGP